MAYIFTAINICYSEALTKAAVIYDMKTFIDQ